MIYSIIDGKHSIHCARARFNVFVCLLLFFGGWGVNVTFKLLRSYHDGACLYQWYFDQRAATQECNVADTGHDTPPRHSIQTRGRLVAVLSIAVERHTGIHIDATGKYTQRTLNYMLLYELLAIGLYL